MGSRISIYRFPMALLSEYLGDSCLGDLKDTVILAHYHTLSEQESTGVRHGCVFRVRSP